MSWACSIPPPLFSATGQLSGLDVLLEELQMDDWEKTNTGCNTEYRVSTCSRCTLSISSVGCTGDYAYVSTRMQPTWSLIRHSASPGMPHSSSLTEELWLKSLLIFHAYGVESIPYPSLLWFYRLFAWGNKKYQTYQGFQTSDCEKRSCPLLAFTSCKTRVVLLSSSFTFLENFSLGEVGFETFCSPPLCIFSVPF